MRNVLHIFLGIDYLRPTAIYSTFAGVHFMLHTRARQLTPVSVFGQRRLTSRSFVTQRSLNRARTRM